VGAEQTLHFQQLIAVLKKCKVGWESKMEHVPFGLIRLNEGKLSTRQGRVITLYEVIEKAIGLAKTSIKAKNPSLENQEDVAKQIGVGAVVFHDLKHQRQKNVIFNWDEVLSFEGDTGPYLQYTHARCCSILRKSNFQPSKLSEADIEDLAKNSELWVAIGRLPNNLKEAAEKREPMILAHAL
jgi:Arginyl-tRNA synthetase